METRTFKEKNPRAKRKLLRSLGIAGFVFFLIKGLVWLVIFFEIGKLF